MAVNRLQVWTVRYKSFTKDITHSQQTEYGILFAIKELISKMVAVLALTDGWVTVDHALPTRPQRATKLKISHLFLISVFSCQNFNFYHKLSPGRVSPYVYCHAMFVFNIGVRKSSAYRNIYDTIRYDMYFTCARKLTEASLYNTQNQKIKQKNKEGKPESKTDMFRRNGPVKSPWRPEIGKESHFARVLITLPLTEYINYF